MNATGTITMTMREVDRFKVIQAVTEARLKPGQAAQRLALTVRQVERPGPRDRARRDALRARDVRTEHRDVLREQQFGQGPRGARAPDAAGPPGEGAAPAQHQHGGGRQQARRNGADARNRQQPCCVLVFAKLYRQIPFDIVNLLVEITNAIDGGRRSVTSPSRVRCTAARSCCASVRGSTKRIAGRDAASQIASASM
jgi:hypothetical protein